MTREEFEAEVQQLEAFARRDPLSYRRRVARLIWLGHGLIYAMLGLCLLLAASLLWLLVSGGLASAIGFLTAALLVLPLGGAILLIVQSLNVRLHPPEGLRLTRGTARTLYDAVDSLSATIGSPRVHGIVLVAEATAAMVQMPRLGLFGWYRNTLVLGLPMMQAMSVPQFSAVIAHEMAHLRGRHGQLGAWVYRTERVWSGLLSSFEAQRKVGSGLLRRILAWYVPKLNAYSFVLRREDEYEADRLSARVVGGTATGEALTVSHLVHGFLSEHFWPKVQRLAGETPNAPPGLFALMGRLLPRVAAASDAYKWLRRGLMLETDLSDTHPCLAERLAGVSRPWKRRGTLSRRHRRSSRRPSSTWGDHWSRSRRSWS